jgi:predicted transcriptional regulator
MSEAIRNFHLPLPEPTYRRLRDAAERVNRPATVVARHAIEVWLRQQRQAAVREAIAAYAAEMAGTPADLDPELEVAALELWEPPKARRRRKR